MSQQPQSAQVTPCKESPAPPTLGQLIELAAMDARTARKARSSPEVADANPHAGEFAAAFASYALVGDETEESRRAYATLHNALVVLGMETTHCLMPALLWMRESPRHRAGAWRLFDWRRKRDHPVGPPNKDKPTDNGRANHPESV